MASFGKPAGRFSGKGWTSKFIWENDMFAKGNMTLKARLYAMFASTLAGLILLGGYSVFELRADILNQKKLAIKALVESSMGVIQEQYDLYKAGKLTEDEAKRLAKDNLRKSRFNDGADYFFIYDLNGNNVMHASKPNARARTLSAPRIPTANSSTRNGSTCSSNRVAPIWTTCFRGPERTNPCQSFPMPRYSSLGAGGWEPESI
jgi:hypothetical protein